MRPLLLDTEIAILSTRLPDPIHGDRADRIIVATAIAIGFDLLTRDEVLLTYSSLGYCSTRRA